MILESALGRCTYFDDIFLVDKYDLLCGNAAQHHQHCRVHSVSIIQNMFQGLANCVSSLWRLLVCFPCLLHVEFVVHVLLRRGSEVGVVIFAAVLA